MSAKVVMQGRVVRSLLCQVEGDEYAIDLTSINAVVAFLQIVPMRDAPAGVLGLVTLRSGTVPVRDMRGPLGLPAADAHATIAWHLHQYVVVISRADRLPVALRVDRVIELASVVVDEASGSSDQVCDSGLRRGRATWRGRSCILLDGEAVASAVPGVGRCARA
jgi:chemotaxis signal transduction protein